MNVSGHLRRRRPKRRGGTALVEFVMSIPLLAFVIAVTFFFGWSMRNQQRVRIADRYAAWRGVYGQSSSPEDLNEMFFGGEGVRTTHTVDDGPGETLEEFVEAAESQSAQAGDLAEELVEERYVPGGRGDEVGSEFTASMDLWRRLASGAIKSYHTREGRSWRRTDCSLNYAILDLYLYDLDEKVNDITSTSVAEAMRSLYLQGW